MSYILDALKKADSERTRDRLPDIHDVLAGTAAPSPGRAKRPRPWLWVAIGLAAGILVAGAMQQVADRAAQAPAASASVTGERAPVPSPSVSVAPPAATLPTSPVAGLPVPALTARTSTPQAAPVETTLPAPSTPFLPPVTKPADVASRPVDTTLAASPALAPPASSATPAEQKATVVALRDLPEAVRQQLPAVKLGGSIYSDRRADRLLIVDGQLAREGDTVAPGLVLEQIGPRSAVFRHGALRVEFPL